MHLSYKRQKPHLIIVYIYGLLWHHTMTDVFGRNKLGRQLREALTSNHALMCFLSLYIYIYVYIYIYLYIYIYITYIIYILYLFTYIYFWHLIIPNVFEVRRLRKCLTSKSAWMCFCHYFKVQIKVNSIINLMLII